jgi:long-subunit acyl-CoA synthetase (AMP-forming)
VLLTHSAVVHTVHSLIVFLEHTSCQLDSDDSMLSYLPLAHIFDR